MFAGVFWDNYHGAAKLKQFSPNIHVVKVDVTDYMSVVHAKNYVEKNLDANRSEYDLTNLYTLAESRLTLFFRILGSCK